MLTKLRQRIRLIFNDKNGSSLIDTQYFIHGGLWLSLPLLINIPLGIVRSIFFARLLTQSTYGKFTFINGLISTLDVLSLNGLSTALTSSVANGKPSAIVSASLTRLRWGLLASICLSGIGYYYYLKGDTDLFIALLFASVMVPLNTALMLVSNYHNGLKRFNTLSKINIIISLLNTVGLVLVVLFIKNSLSWLVIINNASQIIVYGISYYIIIPEIRNTPGDPELVNYGKKLTLANSISSIVTELDSAILGFSSGFVNVAIYNIASVIPNNLRPFTKLIIPLTLPRIVENGNFQYESYKLSKVVIYLILMNSIVVIFSLLCIPTLIALLYGERYTSSIFLACILIFSLLFSIPSNFLIALLTGRKKTKVIYHSNLFSGVFQICSLLILTPFLGTLGVVISRVITNWVTFFFQWYLTSKI